MSETQAIQGAQMWRLRPDLYVHIAPVSSGRMLFTGWKKGDTTYTVVGFSLLHGLYELQDSMRDEFTAEEIRNILACWHVDERRRAEEKPV